MSHLIFKFTDEGAEKLWSYFLAYKRMMGKSSLEKETSKDNFTSFIIPALEQTKTNRRRHRT